MHINSTWMSDFAVINRILTPFLIVLCFCKTELKSQENNDNPSVSVIFITTRVLGLAPVTQAQL